MFQLDELSIPIIAAPMAGGPTTPALAAAVSEVGGLGFLAAGYLSAEQLAERIAATRALTECPFGVNLFVPGPVDPAVGGAVADYAAGLTGAAERAGVAVPAPDPTDEDAWARKVALLRADPVPVVSFVFGLPSPDVVDALRAAGSYLIATVTSAAEAVDAAGFDALCVQGPEAGGHRGTHRVADRPGDIPLPTLLAEVATVTDVPLIAAGGLATGPAIASVLAAGAAAVQLGTVYLRTPEAGTAVPYRDALAGGRYTETALTRAFTGRVARGLRNAFMDAHPCAPAAYPQLHQLTRPLRAAAAANGDPDGMSLWAGTGFRHTTTEPAGELTRRLWREAVVL